MVSDRALNYVIIKEGLASICDDTVIDLADKGKFSSAYVVCTWLGENARRNLHFDIISNLCSKFEYVKRKEQEYLDSKK